MPPPPTERRSGPVRALLVGVRHIASSLSLLLILACADAEPDPDVVVTDSAGVEIVYSGTAVWTDGSAWRIGDRPILQIGVVEGPEEEQFSGLRHAFRLSDGRIVAVNWNNPPEVRVFSPDGTHERSMGGSGGGPGEFQAISFAGALPGDTLVVHDWWRSRLTYFDSGGSLVRTLPLRTIGGRPANEYALQGMFGDGTFLLRPNLMFPADAAGHGRAMASLMRFDGERETLDTLRMIQDFEYAPQDGQRMGLVVFGLRSALAAHGEHLYVGEGEEFRIDVYDVDGRWLRSLRKAYARVPVTPEDVEAERERRLELARSEEARRQLRRGFEDQRVADSFPAHGSRILIDTEGNVWVAHSDGPRATSRAWSVFGADGRFLGELLVPGSFQITDIGADEVLGVWTDEYDVPSVRAFELLKGD